MNEAIALIPARGGSKRVPRKNVRELAGRPAIAWTVDAALKSGLFARVVVSTDDPEIAEAARAAGAETPFVREARLADDHTPTSLVTLDALDRLDPEGRTFDRVCQLMPNCPLRTADDVRASHEQFGRTGAPAQISVTSYAWLNPWWAMTLEPGFRLQPMFEQALKTRSQDLPRAYCPTGAVWWARAAELRAHRTFYVPGHTGWEMPWEHGVDIDTPEDWELAVWLLERRAAAR